jgi:hypothetical protein
VDKVKLNKEEVRKEIKVIKHFPCLFALTVIGIILPLSGGIYLVVDKIYKTRLESDNEIIRLKNEQIDKIKTDCNNIQKTKDTIKNFEEKTSYAPQKKNQSIPNVSIHGNDNVVSQNQSGGQTAHTIYNERPVSRTIKKYQNQLIEELKKIQPIDYDIVVASGDREAYDLAIEIKNAFDSAGWINKRDVNINIGGTYPPGIGIRRDKATRQSELITLTLYNMGLNARMIPKFEGNNLWIYVGPNPDNYVGGHSGDVVLKKREFE